ncbi:Probable diguanylate cyclase YdaM [Slackia heliotrinireducens]|uniref:PAS domain S-box/diguanylate cyclase (GGDEF) domain-containing protein n=1 Tax=Slackia heliotrinireducens (strain ATCC 29202 / DSM 20476 / NCTC 11029 / RHS 1) TaxID=471855 RepID=C7N1Z4_SLAHD|nr:diguanylate cyclase [Slackia heliotrinireducens]ACV23435.1 PAS domain S-box/diguanylate cyclase (GGDEF) domain-containing protein [Slackia heliotrinireducens DSM 20476]VEH02738.1 Probable diguanylate cyclase YdaM [Slackia heliotrinireducens]
MSLDGKVIPGAHHFTSEQLEIILKAVPANVFFKDLDCRYQYVSHICDMLNTGGKGTIIGKTDPEIQPDPELGRKFYEEDKEIIRTGESMKYLQEMTFGPDTYYYEISKMPVIDSDGEIMGVIGMVSDMTEQILTQRKLEAYSQIDSMTGVFNRTFFNKFLDDAKDVNQPMAVIMADCNYLKTFNDNYGHSMGDQLIKSTVENIQQVIGEQGKVVRWGGDEFLLIIPNCDEAACEQIVNRLQETESNVIVCGNPLSTSYGYAIVTQDVPLEQAIDIADKRMYAAKQALKNAIA